MHKALWNVDDTSDVPCQAEAIRHQTYVRFLVRQVIEEDVSASKPHVSFLSAQLGFVEWALRLLRMLFGLKKHYCRRETF